MKPSKDMGKVTQAKVRVNVRALKWETEISMNREDSVAGHRKERRWQEEPEYVGLCRLLHKF